MRNRWGVLGCLFVGLVVAAGCSESKQGAGPPDASGPDTYITVCAADTSVSDGAGQCGDFSWPVEVKPVTITPSTAWASTSELQGPFVAPDSNDGPARIKFTILLQDSTKVYFQDTQRYRLQHEFAAAHLAPYLGWSKAQFDEISLFAKGQQVVTGTVFVHEAWSDSANKLQIAEYGVQFDGLDPMHPELVRTLFALVKANVRTQPEVKAFYFPALSQRAAVKAHKACFDQYGIAVSSPERWGWDSADWAVGNKVPAPGWAVGRLKHFAPNEVESAYRDGRLLPEDVLFTEELPPSLPRVAGVITTAPASVLDHGVELARSFEIPIARLNDASQACGLLTKEVALRARTYPYQDSVVLVEVQGEVDRATRAALATLRQPGAITIVPKASYGALVAPVEKLKSADAAAVGTRAANHGLLRQVAGESAPPAAALTLDLWQQLLDQQLGSGKTLGEEIAAHLDGLSDPPAPAELRSALEAIRELIRGEARFTDAQQRAIEDALASFDAERELVLSPSTNAVDEAAMQIGGLYASMRGCLADDQDSDAEGPSRCDAKQPQEHGLFAAILEVLAGFYEEQAYLERLRRGIDEQQVGMGILVLQAVPATEILARGIARIELNREMGNDVGLTSQLEQGSGPLPALPARPEIMPHCPLPVPTKGTFTRPSIAARSELAPVGVPVLGTDETYKQLLTLLGSIAETYLQEHPELARGLLSVGYSLLKSGKLRLEALERVPLPDLTPRLTPLLIGQSRPLCVDQGYYDVFANHRLKLFGEIALKNAVLDAAHREQSLLASAALQVQVDGGLQQLPWPPSSHAVTDFESSDQFVVGSGAAQRTFALLTNIVTRVSPVDTPLLFPRDLHFRLSATYQTPMPILDDYDLPATSTSETAALLGSACSETSLAATPDSVEQRELKGPNGVAVWTSFTWINAMAMEGNQKVAYEMSGGATFSLGRWVQSEIVGLTSQPLVLRGAFSQSYSPGHHNYWEWFAFEPRLEPGLDPALLAELEAKDIRLLVVFYDGKGLVSGGAAGTTTFYVMGRSGMRPL